MSSSSWISFLCITLLAYAHSFQAHTRDLTGGGDFTVFNRIAAPLILPLPNLDIPPKPVSTEVGFITIRARATIGNEGQCENLQISPGGDLLVTGEFLEDAFVEGFPRPLQVYEMTVAAFQLQFSCTIPLQVEVLTAGFLDTSSNDGTLTFSSTEAIISQKIRLFSEDFTRFPPISFEKGECEADPVFLTYDGNDIGSFAGFDITNLVVNAVRDDESLVFAEVQNNLCQLGDVLAAEIGSLTINNDLVNQSSSFYIANPFEEDEDGQVPALESEKVLRASLADDVLDSMLDFNDRDNFFVELIVPKNPNTESIVTQALSAITDATRQDGKDPLILFMGQTLGVELENDGSIVDFDVISIIDGSLFDPEEKAEVDLSFSFDYSLNETLEDGTDREMFALTASAELTSLLLSVDPPQLDDADSAILPAFQVLEDAQHSLLLEGVDLNNITIKAAFNIVLNMTSRGTDNPDFFYLAFPFEEVIAEAVSVEIQWDGFVATFGLLMAFDLDLFTAIELGPMINFLFECGMSSFVITPRLTGGTVEHERVGVSISQQTDAILVLAADIIEVLIPVYQVVLPRALELVVAETMTDTQLINETECPVTNVAFDDLEAFPFDFSEGVFQDLAGAVNANTANELLDAANLDDIEIILIGDPFIPASGLGFTIPLPPDENGIVQNISSFLEKISLSGIIPTQVNTLTLFETIEDSVFPTQELRNILSIGTEEEPIIINFVLGVTGSEPNPFRDVAEVSLKIAEVNILLDLLLRYSVYDVNATLLADAINVGCWTTKLGFPGGVSDLRVILENIEVDGNCNCSNPIVNAVFDAMIDDDGKLDLIEFIEDGLNRFGDLVENLFSADRIEGTRDVAQVLCETDDIRLIFDIPSIKVEKAAFAFESVLPLMSFFALAVIMPGVVACLMTKCSPRGETKHEENHRHNADLMMSIKEGDSDVELLDHLHLTNALAVNPSIPLYGRILIPLAILMNIGLFIVGDTGDAVAINIVGNIFGVPYEDDGFASLSVISSVIQLYQSGGVVLAVLLFVLSIFWPYLKIFLMICCWVLPPSLLSINRRGKIIEMLDFLGRFSFAEFHFLVFVLVIFQVAGGTPDTGFLPEEDFFELGLEIIPLVSLFTFALAVVVSILISNVMLVFQHNIEDQTRIKLREKHLEALTAKRRDVNLVYDAKDKDRQLYQLSNWNFTVYEKDNDGHVLYQYTYSISKGALLLYAGVVLFALFSLIGAALVATIRVEFVGFFSYLIEFGGGEKEYELSVFELLTTVNQSYDKNFIIYFVSTIFILTVTLIPIVQAVLLLFLLFRAVSVNMARKLTEAHHVISVWCCVDVFVLAVTLTVLELPSIASGLISSLQFCDSLTGIIDVILVPMGYMNEADAEAGCVAIKSSITQGGYVAVLSVFVLALANIVVSRIFYFYIADRERIIESTERRNKDRLSLLSTADQSNVKPFHLSLQKFGLVTIDLEGVRKNLRRDSPARAGGRPKGKTSLSKFMKEQRNILERQEVAASQVSTVEPSSARSQRPKRPAQSVLLAAQSASNRNENVQVTGVYQQPLDDDSAVVPVDTDDEELFSTVPPPPPESEAFSSALPTPQRVMPLKDSKSSAFPDSERAEKSVAYASTFPDSQKAGNQSYLNEEEDDVAV